MTFSVVAPVHDERGMRKTLNERKLTSKEVAELVAAGAKERPELAEAFSTGVARAGSAGPKIYELEGGRILYVYGQESGTLAGKGNILPLDYFLRTARWAQKTRADAAAGRAGSVSQWFHHSKLKARLPEHIRELMSELSVLMLGRAEPLGLSYSDLDAISRYVDSIGVERAQTEIYDHLVAYVGEVMRAKTEGEWHIEFTSRGEAYPYIVAQKHTAIMPINVVSSQLRGIDAVDLRREATNEVRRARAK